LKIIPENILPGSAEEDNDFAVLCAPYFHYPVKNSQIFSQALENNVCLFSWEHLIFMIKNKINWSRI